MLQIRRDGGLLDRGAKLDLHVREAEVRGEARHRAAYRHRGATAHRVRPGCADRVVAPPPPNRDRRVADVRQVEDVPPAVADEEHAAAPLRPPLEDALQIGQVVGEVGPRLEEGVEVGATRGRAPPGIGQAKPAVDARGQATVDRDSGREHAHSGVDSELPVPGVGDHVQHGRHPAAVLGGEAAGLQLGPSHHVGIEYREDAAQVEGVEDRHSVEEDEVLVRGSAPNVEGRREVGHRGHAGEHLDGPQRIRLGDHREGLEGRGADLLHGGAHRLLEARPRAAAGGLDRDALDLDRRADKHDLHLPRRPPGHAQLLPVILEPQLRHGQHVGTRPHVAEGKESQRFGQRELREGGVPNRVEPRQRPFDRATVLRPDAAVDRTGLRRRRSGGEEGEKQEQGGPAAAPPPQRPGRPRLGKRCGHRLHGPPRELWQPLEAPGTRPGGPNARPPRVRRPWPGTPTPSILPALG